jgi:thiol-disulfide isomerase/thioredoxin
MTNRIGQVRAFGTGLALASVVASCSNGSGGDKTDTLPREVGRPAPAYAVTSVAGDAVSVAALRGNVVLLNAWATWCAPCRDEIPEIRALHAKYAPQGLQVVGVTLDDESAVTAVQDFVKQYDMKYAIWRDPEQKFSTVFQFEGLPMTVLVDKTGVLRWIRMGRLDARDTTLDAAIRKALVM